MTLEELLNRLIEKGWKPFGCKEKIKEVYFLKEAKSIVFFFETLGDNCRTRELVSKESGLWQFVCENEMRPKRVGYEEHYWQRDNHTNGRGMAMESEPEYRLIESSLKDESELEDFLLSNIVIKDE